MTGVVVVGIQWGDEGKGKIVDFLSKNADMVVRFQGGDNAGHTVVVNGTEYKLSLLPSGVLRREKLSIIGNGVVLNPVSFLNEIESLGKQGVNISPSNLLIAENTTLVLPIHKELDALREKQQNNLQIGTTCRGIGPAYEDKVGRRAIRLADLADDKYLSLKVEQLLKYHNSLRKNLYDATTVDHAELLTVLHKLRGKMLPYAAQVWKIIHEYLQTKRNVLFEGAQGTLLDLDHGTYPFVTSSNTLAGQATVGTGVGPNAVDCVLGVVKAYVTRVGEGIFPTEEIGEIGNFLGRQGREFGTVTGRRRRCGWFDAVLARQAVDINGVNGIALTKLDVLDDLSEIKICTGYRSHGDIIDSLPVDLQNQSKLEPIYETIQGWKQKTHGVRNKEDLPKQALAYINRIEALANTKVMVLSTGPERMDTIVFDDPFTT